MRTIFITLLASVGLLRAETTNAPAVEQSGATIESKMAKFNYKTRETTYWGSVRVSVPPLQMRCDYLTARAPTNSSHPDSIVASSNVVVLVREPDGAIYTNWSDKAVYTFKPDGSLTNETLVLSGSPVVIKWETKSSTADEITWDIGHDSIFASNLQGVFPNVKSLKKPSKREPAATTPTPAPPPVPTPQPANP